MSFEETIKAVSEYTARGWVVHPLSSPKDKKAHPGKRPLIKEWQRITKTPDNIEVYIRKDCNLGLVCGKASDVTIIDLDSELFIDELFQGLEIETLKSKRTEGRGHVYFKYCPELKAQKHHDLGIEILSNGNNAVLPPSIHLSGDIYRWNRPDAIIIEMPPELVRRINKLFQTEKELKLILAKCRKCFREVIKTRPNMHGGEGWEYMFAICTELKANGATEEHAKMFARLMYGNDYDEKLTLEKWRQIDPAKTRKCDTIRATLAMYIDTAKCENCNSSMGNIRVEQPEDMVSELGIFKDNFELAEMLQRKLPIYYDVSKNMWAWQASERYWKRIDETDVLSKARKKSGQYVIDSKTRNEIITAIQITGRDREVKDINKNWIHAKDFVYDLPTKTKFEATPEHFFSAPIPHRIGQSEDTPTIDKLFKEWMGDNIAILYEICAYLLLDDYPIHRMFLLFGRGRNGKGQFLELLERFVGKQNKTTTDLELLLLSRFEASKLYKKKLATVGETNFNELKNTGKLKMLTGADQIGGEFKHKDPFDFHNTAKIVIATNSLPESLDKTDGFYSRCIILEFKNQFPDGKDIVDTIPEQEYENLLLKCLNLLTGLLDRGRFTNEGTIEDKAKKYEKLSNPFETFKIQSLTDACDAVTPMWIIQESYETFCKKNGFRIISKKELTQILKRDGYEVKQKRFGEKNWQAVFGLGTKEAYILKDGVAGNVEDVEHVEQAGYYSPYVKLSVTPSTSSTSSTLTKPEVCQQRLSVTGTDQDIIAKIKGKITAVYTDGDRPTENDWDATVRNAMVDYHLHMDEAREYVKAVRAELGAGW